jgi:hypothetical protein
MHPGHSRVDMLNLASYDNRFRTQSQPKPVSWLCGLAWLSAAPRALFFFPPSREPPHLNSLGR